MEVEGKAAVSRPERRVNPRYDLDEAAVLLLVASGTRLQCKVVDFGLVGCRLRVGESFHGEVHDCIEVTFTVRGAGLRFRGVVQWTDGGYLVGIRFVGLSPRRKGMLFEVLSEFEAAAAAGAKKEVAEEQARVEAEMRALTSIAELPQPSQPQEKPAKSERRAQLRHEVYDSAVIHLINVGCSLNGHILDLSLGGCRICTDECFPVGIHVRIETEFRLAGIPFRLGGVIQVIHDQHNVGIRFLDMSDRKREQVEQLIEEIQEAQARRKLADEGDLSEEDRLGDGISEDGEAGD